MIGLITKNVPVQVLVSLGLPHLWTQNLRWSLLICLLLLLHLDTRLRLEEMLDVTGLPDLDSVVLVSRRY